jgi:serine phosphatase RsbU (regulator of sigma subunit)
MNELAVLPPLLSVSKHYRDAADQVIRCISEGTYCALIGPRFSGKSELLRVVRHMLMQDQACACLFLDMQDVESSTQTGFFTTLIDTTAARVKQLTGRKLPTSDEQPATSAVFRAFLSDCAARIGRDLVLVIDNLDAIPNDLVQALLTSLRAAYMDQHDSDHQLVVVLSGALSLATRTVGESSPLRGIVERVLMAELSESESETLIAGHLAAEQITFTAAAQERLLRAARGDPALIDWLCQRCAQVVLGTPLIRLTANTAKRAIREFLSDEAPRYAPIQEAIRLIEEDPDLLQCILRLLERSAVPMRELPLPLSPDLDPLYLTGMVRRVYGDHYQLRNEVYRQYLAQHFDPGRVGHLLTMSGRWDTAIDSLEDSIRVGNDQYRSDLLAATINSMYAAEDVEHAAHYLIRGLSAAFDVREAQVRHAVQERHSLRLVGQLGETHAASQQDQEIPIAADRLEARAYREKDSLRGQETNGGVTRAVPLLIPGPTAIGIVRIVDRLTDIEPALQRELDLQLIGYLNQAARAIHEVNTRQEQLTYIATLEHERTAQELRVAREIQVSFLPEQCPSLPGWEIAADWRAAREVGGDFYDFIPLGRERLGLLIADVSDKGVPAALFMSLSSTLLRVSAAEMESPAHTLQHVNELILKETRSDMFLTLFYGILNCRTGSLTYVNAGHPAPVLWRCPETGTAAQSAEPQVTTLAAKGTIVGIFDEIALEEKQVTIHPGDILILYTDGVTEPINEQGEEFGEERLVQTIASNCDKPCDEIVNRIREAVSGFAGDLSQFDDYTLVGIKRTA